MHTELIKTKFQHYWHVQLAMCSLSIPQFSVNIALMSQFCLQYKLHTASSGSIPLLLLFTQQHCNDPIQPLVQGEAQLQPTVHTTSMPVPVRSTIL